MARIYPTLKCAIHGMVNINDDRQRPTAKSKDYFNHYYGPSYPPEEPDQIWLAHGPPKDCARLIQEWIDMGITTPVLRFHREGSAGSGERFIDEVLPLLRLK